MDQKETTHRRLLLLLGFLFLVLAIYGGVLYKVQVLQHDYYLAQSVRTIAREESVEASRGVIADRNGQPMVSSRSSYSLSFDPSLLSSKDDENEALLRLLELCESQNVEWTDTLPLSKTAPFVYTLDDLGADSTLRKRFTKFLQDELKILSTNVSASTLNENRLDRMDLDADTLIQKMREHYQVPASFTDQQARQVLGVQYELSLRKLIYTTAYVLAKDINTEMISLLNDGDYAGAQITSSSVREYQTECAAHILGTVGLISDMEEVADLPGEYGMDDTIGKGGVELAFERYLKGTDGRRIVSTNSDGKITGEYWSQEPKPGNTVQLTIDLDLQTAVEHALSSTVKKMNAQDGKQTRGASAVVTSVGTGEVLALASYPSFHLETYRQDYTNLSDLNLHPDRPLWNRATQGTYAPGSTFKPLTAIASLQEGIITPGQRIHTTGHWTYPGAPNSYANCWIYNASRGSHGSINVSEAITVSCNYFFAQMGYELGMDRLNQYAKEFGFGQHTGIEIGDKAGSLVENKPGENLAPWAAFGQAQYLFTPLQLSNYMATLVSGGKHCEAHLLKTVKSADHSQVLAVGNTEPLNTIDIQPANLNAVKQGMHNLTTTGSLKGAFQQCIVPAGAKTGTAQINSHTKNTGVFVCFAPYEDPQIALALLVEEGSAGAALASTAVEILNAYFSAENQEEQTLISGEQQLLP